MTRFVCLSLLGLSLSVSPALAATFYAGTCHAGSFSTISAAANAAPAGSIINVCPGAYDEQVVISKSLTLQGLPNQAANQAEVRGVTTGGTTQSAVFGLDLQPTIWVKSGTVTIANLTVIADEPGTSGCPLLATAILYASGSTGTINHVVSLAEAPTTNCGVGIWAENTSLDASSIKIENSYIRAFNFGILAASQQAEGFAPVLANTITGNTIVDAAHGVYLFQTRGKVSGNNILNDGLAVAPPAVYGISQNANSTIITANWFSNMDQGVIIAVPFATVTNNKIAQVRNGIDLGCFANGTVSGNMIQGQNGLVDVPSTFIGTGKNIFFLATNVALGGC
jgi:hypothetical protein